MPQVKGTYLFYNEEYITKDEFRLPLDNRAFCYADGFFETLFCTGTNIPFFKYHYLRIEAAFKIYQFDTYCLPSEEELKKQIVGLLVRNKYFTGARVRITFSRKAGGLYTPESNTTDVLMLASELPYTNYELNRDGLAVDIASDTIVSCNRFSVFKNVGAMPYVMAGIEKKKYGCDDLILLNEKGEMVEAISSNLFLVKNGLIFTPGLKSGCVGGIVRQVLIEHAKSANLMIKQRPIKPDDLMEADELFLTNAIQGIRWVSSFRHKRYYNILAKRVHQFLTTILVDYTH